MRGILPLPGVGSPPWRIVVVSLGMALVSCNAEPPEEPSRLIVAVLDDKKVTVGHLEDYFAGIFQGEEEQEEEQAGALEMNRVKSRLLDNFLDEELLLLEAERRGIRVEQAEIDAYLGVDTAEEGSWPGGDRPTRRRARRNLMIQKLRGAVIGADVEVSPEEVEAYLQEHGGDLLPEDHVVLRSLALTTKSDADRIRREIVRKKMTFAQAVSVFGTTPDQGKPLDVDLNALPEELQKVVHGLQPGQVSRAVVYQGKAYLFLLDAWGAKAELEKEELRERALRELLRLKSRQTLERLLRRLRGEVEVKVYNKALPFRYIPEQE